jgi:hypothetical protein
MEAAIRPNSFSDGDLPEDEKTESAISPEEDADVEDAGDQDGDGDGEPLELGPGWKKDAIPGKGCLMRQRKKVKRKVDLSGAEGAEQEIRPEAPKDRKSVIGFWLAPVAEALNPNNKTQYSPMFAETPSECFLVHLVVILGLCIR